MDIFKKVNENRIDYSEVIKTCQLRIVDKDPVDVSVIIPVQGRTEFNNILCHFLKRAIDFSGKKISVTFVEHDETPKHKDLINDWVNYIFIPQQGKPFNKCLCHNIGAIYGTKSDYFLFHDSDILMDKHFFRQIFENMKDKDAVQTFTKRRLLLCGKICTERLLKDYKEVRNLPVYSSDIRPAQSGASGGSIFTTRDIFIKVGGFDTIYSEYSIEDEAFFQCLNIAGAFGFCDKPSIELLHLNHAPSFWRRTKQSDWDYFHAFKELDPERKKVFIKLRSQLLIPYFNEATITDNR